MDRFPKTFDFFRSAAASRPRSSRPKRNRLCFESLEARAVMSAAPVVTTVPFTFVDNTLNSAGTLMFPASQVYIAIYGQDYTTAATNYYFTPTGAAVPTTSLYAGLAPSAPEPIVPDFTLNELTAGPNNSYTINLPEDLGGISNGIQSARAYVSMGTPLDLTVNQDGSVNAESFGPSFFDYFEFSLNAPANPTGNINIDTTNVDQFGVPIQISLTSTDPNNISGGVGTAVSRASVISQFETFAADTPFAISLLATDPTTGLPYRILNPSHVLKSPTYQPATNQLQVQTVLIVPQNGDITPTQTSLVVADAQAFPDPMVAPFNIQIDNEVMTVTGAATVSNGIQWTVERGQAGTAPATHQGGTLVTLPTSAPVQTTLSAPTTGYITADQTSIDVASAAGFPTDPATTPFNIQVDQEIMTVTAAAAGPGGTTTWTVERGQGGSVAGMHANGVIVVLPAATPTMNATQTTLTIGNDVGFPTTFPFVVQVDSELMNVTASSQNTDGTFNWTVTRGIDGTTAAPHNEGALVTYDPVTAVDLNSYFNNAIDKLFTSYDAGQQLSITSKASGSTVTYTGTVVKDTTTGDYVFRFTDGTPGSQAYDIYYPFFTNNQNLYNGFTPTLAKGVAPTYDTVNVANESPSEMVFSCDGVFGDSADRPGLSAGKDSQQAVLGDLENQMVSALNRGVALLPTTTGTGSWQDSSLYYGQNSAGQPNAGEAWNLYAQFLHQSSVSLGGLNYGFAYDDQDGQASDIGVSTFSQATITFGPWDSSSPTPPNPPNPPNPPTPPSGAISMRNFLSSGITGVHSQISTSVVSPQITPTSLTISPTVTPQQQTMAVVKTTPPPVSTTTAPAKTTTSNVVLSMRSLLFADMGWL